MGRVAWRTLRHLGQRMLSGNLSIWWILTVMVVVVAALSTCEGYNLNAPEELETMERQVRAPFNGMRGKRGPFSLNMYKKYLLKRAPFNGMRGKRGEEENLNQYESDQDELGHWGHYDKRGRGFGSGFVGMRGRK